jgi:hypothetical protein
LTRGDFLLERGVTEFSIRADRITALMDSKIMVEKQGFPSQRKQMKSMRVDEIKL